MKITQLIIEEARDCNQTNCPMFRPKNNCISDKCVLEEREAIK